MAWGATVQLTKGMRGPTIMAAPLGPSVELRMTPEEISCFCETKGATVRVESPVGTITYSPKGIQTGPTVFGWQGDPLPPFPSQQEVLDKAEKFIIQPKFGDKKELSREKFEQLLKT